MEYQTEVNGKHGDHEIVIDFEYSVYNDGIGSYEFWGAKGYDKGCNYIEIEEVTYAAIIREGHCSSLEECPKCSNVKITKIKPDGYEKCYFWTHKKQIDVESDAVKSVIEYLDNSGELINLVSDEKDDYDYDYEYEYYE